MITTPIILYILAAFCLSLFCGFVTIPMVIRFCHKHNLYDIPNARKVHKNNIPRLGGVSFLPATLLAFCLSAVMLNINLPERELTVSLWAVIFLGGLVLIYVTGLIDDVVGLSARIKFIAQILAACLFPVSGLYLNSFYGFLGITEIPFWIGAPLTVFIIVFINNAINLIDGIDGLSSGLSVIALAGFLVGYTTKGIWGYSILIAGLMGVIIAFMYFNLFGDAKRGTKIFMGDSGSLTIGYILGFLAIKYSMDAPTVMVYHRVSLLLSYSLVIVPVYDVCRMVMVRWRHHRPIFDADKNHIHHKLMRTGLSGHQALIVLLSLAVAYIALNMSMYKIANYSIIVATDIVTWIAFQMFINRRIRQRGEQVYVAPQK